MDENKVRIITKRASKIRFTISNALGGIGKVEIAIIVIDFLITALIFSFLFKYQIIASVLITIFMWLTSLILMFPTKNGTKLYSVIWTAFKYIFVKKQNNDVLKISQIQKIENNTIKFKHKTSVVYRIEAVDISLANQQERDIPIYKLSSIFKTIDIDFEICKIQIPYEFLEQIKHIDNLIEKEKTEFKKTQLANLKNWYLNLQYGNQKLKTAYFLMITGDNVASINQKLRYVINEFDNNIKFIKATFEETSLLVQRNIIPTNNVVDKPHKIRQFANYVTVDNKFISYLTVSQYPLLVPDTWLGFLANLSNVNVNIKVHHISEQEALKLLDSAINRAEIQTTSKTSEEIKYQSYLEHFTELMNMVQNGGETLKMVFGPTKITFNASQTTIGKQAIKNPYKIRVFNNGIIFAINEIIRREMAYNTEIIIDFINEFFENKVKENFNTQNEEQNNNLNIKGQWGSGKTTYIKKLEKELEEKKYQVKIFNVWEYEISDNIFVSVLCDILNLIYDIKTENENTKKSIKKVLKNLAILAGHGLTYALDFWIPSAGSMIRGCLNKNKQLTEEEAEKNDIDPLFELIKTNQYYQLLNDTIEIIKGLIGDKKYIIIFDELDRCTTSKMIEFLSIIKNILFKLNNCFFIVSCDSDRINKILIQNENNENENYTDKIFYASINIKVLSNLDKINVSDKNELITNYISKLFEVKNDYRQLKKALEKKIKLWTLLKKS